MANGDALGASVSVKTLQIAMGEFMQIAVRPRRALRAFVVRM
jgi:hypothetical protein